MELRLRELKINSATRFDEVMRKMGEAMQQYIQKKEDENEGRDENSECGWRREIRMGYDPGGNSRSSAGAFFRTPFVGQDANCYIWHNEDTRRIRSARETDSNDNADDWRMMPLSEYAATLFYQRQRIRRRSLEERRRELERIEHAYRAGYNIPLSLDEYYDMRAQYHADRHALDQELFRREVEGEWGTEDTTMINNADGARVWLGSVSDIRFERYYYRQGDIFWREPTRNNESERANNLLLEHLDKQQRKQWESSWSFAVQGSEGNHYTVYDIIVRDRNNVAYCLQAEDCRVPTADVVLARKLLIEADEGEFLRRANRLEPKQ